MEILYMKKPILILFILTSCSIFAPPLDDLINGIQNNDEGAVKSALIEAETASPRLEIVNVHIDRPGGNRTTPLKLAISLGRIDIITLILEDLVIEEPGFFKTISSNYLSRISYLNGVEDTVLHQAAIEGQCEILKLLLKKRADINCLNGSRQTALEAAAFHFQLDSVELLLNAGADSLIVGWYGRTPLSVLKFRLNDLVGDRPYSLIRRLNDLVITDDLYRQANLIIRRLELQKQLAESMKKWLTSSFI